MVIRQLDDIKLADFASSPYWMFYSGPHGEFDPFTTLVPQSHPDYDDQNVRLILATYRLNAGQQLSGYFYEDPDRPYQHTLFVDNDTVSLWSGIRKPTEREMAALYSGISTSSESVFPIAWVTYGSEYSGSIAGFGYFGPGHIIEFIK